jgi:hypothetical protein
VYAIHFETVAIPAHCFTEENMSPINDDTNWESVYLCGDRISIWGKYLEPGPKQLQKNLEQGIWSCLLLGSDLEYGWMLLLIVDWRDSLTASRVGGFYVRFPDHIEDIGKTIEQEYGRRKVRLI